MPGSTLTTRSTFFRVAGGAAAAGVVLSQRPAGAASSEQDAEILRFVLQLEQLQAAFYAEAFDAGVITGEVREFARVVGGHERAHIEFIAKALGGTAPGPPGFDFGAAVREPAVFFTASRRIEDLGVRAYNAQAPNLTAGALRAAARIASVEARHAAWIRDLAGEDPAPDAAEPVQTFAEVQEQLRDTGFLR